MALVMSANQICRMALGQVGATLTVQDFTTETTTEARACQTYYEPTRDALLASFEWPFAEKREDLGLLTLVTRDGWQYAYALPDDCVYARYLWTGVRDPPKSLRAKFKEEYDSNGGTVLLTDVANANLVYTFRHEEPTRYPMYFVDALAAELAARLAMPLVKEPGLRSNLMQVAQYVTSVAMSRAAQEGEPDDPPDSEMIRARD